MTRARSRWYSVTIHGVWAGGDTLMDNPVTVKVRASSLEIAAYRAIRDTRRWLFPRRRISRIYLTLIPGAWIFDDVSPKRSRKSAPVPKIRRKIRREWADQN